VLILRPDVNTQGRWRANDKQTRSEELLLTSKQLQDDYYYYYLNCNFLFLFLFFKETKGKQIKHDAHLKKQTGLQVNSLMITAWQLKQQHSCLSSYAV